VSGFFALPWIDPGAGAGSLLGARVRLDARSSGGTRMLAITVDRPGETVVRWPPRQARARVAPVSLGA
jgi:hypothetical protein